MKYVMFSIEEAVGQRFFPIIFGDFEIHSQVAEAISTIKTGTKAKWERLRPEPVSAGSITFDEVRGWVCYGSSESLGLRMHPDDSKIINGLSYTFGRGYDPRTAKGEGAGAQNLAEDGRKLG